MGPQFDRHGHRRSGAFMADDRHHAQGVAEPDNERGGAYSRLDEAVKWIDDHLCTYEMNPWKCRRKLFIAVFMVSTIALVLIYGDKNCFWR